MSTFNDDEVSRADSRPREFIEINHGSTYYYVATGDRDIAYNGHTFVATPSARSELRVDTSTGQVVLEVSLPATHALAQRYVALGSPPRQILVTVRRMQMTSGEVMQIWIGYVTALSFAGHEAKFAVPMRGGQALQINLPTMLVDTLCTHVLYDHGCQLDRAANTITATVATVDGRDVTVSSISAKPDHWADNGELIHVASGERMTVTEQVGTTITMQAPIVELHVGDSVQIAAGCKHDLDACGTFGNVVNYGGLPQRPTGDIYIANGFGVVEQI